MSIRNTLIAFAAANVITGCAELEAPSTPERSIETAEETPYLPPLDGGTVRFLTENEKRAKEILDTITSIGVEDCPEIANPDGANTVVDSYTTQGIVPYRHCKRFVEDIQETIGDEIGTWGTDLDELFALNIPFSVYYKRITTLDGAVFYHFELSPEDANGEFFSQEKIYAFSFMVNNGLTDYFTQGIKTENPNYPGVYIWAPSENQLSVKMPTPRDSEDSKATISGRTFDGLGQDVNIDYAPNDTRLEPLEGQLAEMDSTIPPLMEEMLAETSGSWVDQLGTLSESGTWNFTPEPEEEEN